MPQSAVLTLRVIVTLACLVGVPAIALVGIPSGEIGNAQLGVSAEPPQRITATNSASHRAQSQESRTRSSTTQPETSEPLPTGTIKDVSVQTLPASHAGQVDPASFAAATPPDALTRQLQRLQELGASYYRLECSPNAVADFVFHCRLAGVEQPFSATATTPTSAVEQVIRAIEQWHAQKTDTHRSAKSVYLR